MDLYIDLHTHSTKSDGTMTPSELVRYAAAKGLTAVAITDHDTVDGVEEALEEGTKAGIEVIPGVEVSVDYSTEMHILGYFTPKNYMNMEITLARLREYCDERNPKMIDKLKQMGIDISMREVIDVSGGDIVSRSHMAKVLVNKGYAKDISDAFNKYLGAGSPAYFKKEKLSPAQAIKKILQAGGLPVLAHPIYLNKSRSELDELLEYLVKEGLKGIEAYYVDNTREDDRILSNLADKHNLLVTGGSDFHGQFKKDIEIGTGHGNLRVPYWVLTRLKNALGT